MKQDQLYKTEKTFEFDFRLVDPCGIYSAEDLERFRREGHVAIDTAVDEFLEKRRVTFFAESKLSESITKKQARKIGLR